MIKRTAFTLALLLFLLAVESSTSVLAKDTWRSVRSKNFLLVGNASEKDIRQVATRLEQFREVFSRLFTNVNINSPTDSFSHMELITFTADAGGQVTCGLRKPEDNVVVAYVPTSDARSKVDGVVKSVEFVPQNFKLKP